MADDVLYSYDKGFGDGGTARLGKYYVRLSVGKYLRKGPFDASHISPEKYIYLPLPMEMRDDTNVSFNNVDTGLAGNILDNGFSDGGSYAAEVLRQSGNIASKIGGVIGSGVMAVGKNAPFLSMIGKGIGSSLDSALPAESITSALSQSMGISPNPNSSVIFQGPRLREINLNWMFMPTSPQDSKNIRKVINYLKKAALPKNSIQNSAAILEYPYLAQVNFYPWDSGGPYPYCWTDKSIIRMKYCFMSTVNANYTAGNTPAFFEGTNEPVAIGLSINFVEAEYFLANDYDDTVNGEASTGLVDYIVDRFRNAAKKVGVDNVSEDDFANILSSTE